MRIVTAPDEPAHRQSSDDISSGGQPMFIRNRSPTVDGRANDHLGSFRPTTRGGDVLLVRDVGEMPERAFVAVSVGGRPCPLVAGAEGYVYDDTTRTAQEIRCVVPAGEGVQQQVVVRNTMTNQTSTGGGLLAFDYAAPVVTAVELAGHSCGSGAGCPPVVSTEGGRIRLRGDNFGTATATLVAAIVMPVARERELAASASNTPEVVLDVTPVSHSEVEVTVPAGYGADHQIVLEVSGQGSNTDLTFSYQRPSVVSVSHEARLDTATL